MGKYVNTQSSTYAPGYNGFMSLGILFYSVAGRFIIQHLESSLTMYDTSFGSKPSRKRLLSYPETTITVPTWYILRSYQDASPRDTTSQCRGYLPQIRCPAPSQMLLMKEYLPRYYKALAPCTATTDYSR
jgi:hypothetical protein